VGLVVFHLYVFLFGILNFSIVLCLLFLSNLVVPIVLFYHGCSFVAVCKLVIIIIFPLSLMASVMRSTSISSLGILLSTSKSLYISSLFVLFIFFHPIVIFCVSISFVFFFTVFLRF